MRGFLQGLGVPLALAGALAMAAATDGSQQIAGAAVSLTGVGLIWASALFCGERWWDRRSGSNKNRQGRTNPSMARDPVEYRIPGAVQFSAPTRVGVGD